MAKVNEASRAVERDRPPFADVDIASPEFKRDPHRFFARCRDEMPVCRVPLPARQSAWLVTRYDDVAAALTDPRLVKDPSRALTEEQAARQPWVPSIFRPLTRNMLDLDAPDHTRLRALVQKAFTPRLIERLRERIQSLADELLSAASTRSGIDLIRDFALPIPTTVISEMLGVPPEDRTRFHLWSKRIVATSPSGIGRFKAVPAVLAFLRFIRRLIRIRRVEPRDDLMSALVQAEEGGHRMSEDELVAMVFLLLIAGHETTVNLIGNGTLALLRHPDQRDRLRAEPGLLSSAIEELLRFDGPLMTATERWTREDLSIADVPIPRGALVYAALASANRDERRFTDPDSLEIGRDPNKHLAFGLGSHYCLGAPLARLEGQIAIGTLVRRFPGLRLRVSPEELRWRRGLVLRGLERLPLRVGN